MIQTKINATLNRWIVGEIEKTTTTVTTAIENYRFNEAAEGLYHFIWHTYCDWYVELSKPVFNSDDEDLIAETRAVTAWVLDEMIKLLHPFMPFMTEELWQRLGEQGRNRETMLIKAGWPAFEGLRDEAASAEIEWVISLISQIRSARSEMNVPAGAKIPLVLVGASDVSQERAKLYENTLKQMARLDSIAFAHEVPSGSVQVVVGEAVACLQLSGVIDVTQETQRLNKELGKVAGEIKKLSGKLSNEKFLSNAPEEIVTEQKRRLTEEEERAAQLNAALERLKELG